MLVSMPLAKTKLKYEMRSRHWSAIMEELEYLDRLRDVHVATLVRYPIGFNLATKGVWYLRVSTPA